MRNLKRNATDELIYETETDLQTQRMNLQLLEGETWGKGSQGVWDGHVHTAVFNMDNQQGPLLSVLWQPGWDGSLGEKEYAYVNG